MDFMNLIFSVDIALKIYKQVQPYVPFDDAVSVLRTLATLLFILTVMFLVKPQLMNDLLDAAITFCSFLFNYVIIPYIGWTLCGIATDSLVVICLYNWYPDWKDAFTGVDTVFKFAMVTILFIIAVRRASN